MVRPLVLKFLSVCTAVMSFFVVWSEVLFFVKSPVLSLFAVFVQSAQVKHNYFAIEVCSLKKYINIKLIKKLS